MHFRCAMVNCLAWSVVYVCFIEMSNSTAKFGSHTTFGSTLHLLLVLHQHQMVLMDTPLPLGKPTAGYENQYLTQSKIITIAAIIPVKMKQNHINLRNLNEMNMMKCVPGPPFLLVFIVPSLIVTSAESSLSGEKMSERKVGIKARYDNFALYRLHIKTEEQVKILQELEEKSDSYVFYGHALRPDQRLTVMVGAHKLVEIEELISRFGIGGEILEPNVQSLIDAEAKRIKPSDTKPEDVDWNDYLQLDTINNWLDYIVEKYDYIERVDLGQSFNGQTVKGIKFAKNDTNPTIFIEAGIHAREWISPATTTFIINQLITSNRPEVQDMANNFNWFFFPVVNPDGYRYTFEKDRLWRKNRKPYGLYLGVDLNRNFDANWNGTGSSSDPQRYDFCGSEAFSEPETNNIAEFFKLNGKKERINTYIALHSFSQLMMFPYGYTTEKPVNYDDLKVIAEKAVEAIKMKHGKEYVCGSSIETIYPSSGSSSDWVYEKGFANISYIIELRGSVESTNMFILPADEIIPTGEEILEAFIALLKEGKSRVN
uniref:Zinc carboxypeptidase A 1 n=1 Tax=Culicoides sonorensis TaxID=179676 RepID=A0A336MQX1_CULSO